LETVILKVTSAIVVGGEVMRAGDLVEVTRSEAKDLLHRGKAELATEADAPKAVEPESRVELEEIDEPQPSGKRGRRGRN
jgi:hypothetical protein